MVERTDVLIIGAGPSGLAAAIELLKRDVAVTVVDRKPGVTDKSKALLVWRPVLDYLNSLNAEIVKKWSIPTRGFEYWSGQRQEAKIRFGMDNRPALFPQNYVEEVLLGGLEDLGGEVHWSTHAVIEKVEVDGVSVRMEALGAGAEKVSRITADWVIAADGDRSATREAAGLAYDGIKHDQKFVVSDFTAESTLSEDIVYYSLAPGGTTVISALPNSHYRIFGALPATIEGAGDRAQLEQHVYSMAQKIEFGELRPLEFFWTSVFSIHARVASNFVNGRIILVGNSAHSHSPAGGQGLNAGVLDSLSLGWRLAGVVRGSLPVDVLNDYGKERLAVARDIVRNTELQMKVWNLRGFKTRLRHLALSTLDRTNLLGVMYLNMVDGRSRTGVGVRRRISVGNPESTWETGNRVPEQRIWNAQLNRSESLLEFMGDKTTSVSMACSGSKVLGAAADTSGSSEADYLVEIRPDLIVSEVRKLGT